MDDGGGGDPDDQKGAVRVKGVREGHELFFGIMNQIELDNPDLPCAVHEFDKKSIVHVSISPEMNFTVRPALGQVAKLYIEKTKRNGLALDRDSALSIDRDPNDFRGFIGLALGGGEFELKRGKGE